MDPYSFCLTLGGAGLTIMALGGLGHRGHSSSGPRGGRFSARLSQRGARASASRGASPRGHVKAGAHHGHHHGHHSGHRGLDLGGRVSDVFWALTSPRVAFSLLVGFGATGLVLERWLGGPWLIAASTLGAIAFELGLVAPMWRAMLRFASAPAMTLETAVMDEAKAVTGFDARGHGLVAIALDGQLVQVLGTLRSEDRAAGVRVRAGDRVRVEAVDASRNSCTVSRL
jgi:hypothetical protein